MQTHATVDAAAVAPAARYRPVADSVVSTAGSSPPGGNRALPGARREHLTCPRPISLVASHYSSNCKWAPTIQHDWSPCVARQMYGFRVDIGSHVRSNPATGSLLQCQISDFSASGQRPLQHAHCTWVRVRCLPSASFGHRANAAGCRTVP